MFEPTSISPSNTNALSSTVHNLSNSSSLSNGKKFEILKALPKYNAHCHLGGEIPAATLLKYGSPAQIQALTQAMSEIASGKEYEKAFCIFPLISQIINTHEKLKEATFQTCQQFKCDNNQVVLMRTSLKQLDNRDYEEYLKTVLEGIQEAASDDFNIFLMLSLKRSSSLEMAKLTVDLTLKYREKGLVGIDISDISTIGDIKTIIPELLRAKENGLKIAVHMGESAQEQDQMFIIRELKPDLIDHGVNLCEEAKEWIKKQNIPVTVCLTSSIATKMHHQTSPHPWITEHLKSEHPIDLGTDDSTVFGNIVLSDELFRLCSDLEFDKILQIAEKSLVRARSFFSTFSVFKLNSLSKEENIQKFEKILKSKTYSREKLLEENDSLLIIKKKNDLILKLQDIQRQQIVDKLQTIFAKAIFIKHRLSKYNDRAAYNADLAVEGLIISKIIILEEENFLNCPFSENGICDQLKFRMTIKNEKIDSYIEISNLDCHLIDAHHFFPKHLNVKKIIEILEIYKDVSYKAQTKKIHVLDYLENTNLIFDTCFKTFFKEELLAVRKFAKTSLIQSFEAYLLPYRNCENEKDRVTDGYLYLHFFSNEDLTNCSFKINDINIESNFSKGYSIFQIRTEEDPLLMDTDGIALIQDKSILEKDLEKLTAINKDFRLPQRNRNPELIREECTLL